MTDREAMFLLAMDPKIGRQSFRRLLAAYDSPAEALAHEGTFGFTSLLNPAPRAGDTPPLAERQRLMEKHLNAGMRFLLPEDPEFPDRLKQIPDPPLYLFVRGTLPPDDQPLAAVVGARRCSRYGMETAEKAAADMARAGIGVVSGMARGIDGAAHRGALNADGLTYAVLGCGADICYPTGHIGLMTDILRRGAVISEYPPGSPPIAFHFPERNRLISGLASVLLVVEARPGSGSLHTVSHALDQGRDILAVPGRIDEPLSRGTNALIRDGAIPYTGFDDLLPLFPGLPAASAQISSDKKSLSPVASPEEMVYSCLNLSPCSRDEIMRRTGFSMEEINRILLALELGGRVRRQGALYGKLP